MHKMLYVPLGELSQDECIHVYSFLGLSFIYSHCCTVLSYIYYHWLVHSCVAGHSGCCQFLGVLYTAAVNILVDVFWWTHVCFLLSICLGLELQSLTAGIYSAWTAMSNSFSKIKIFQAYSRTCHIYDGSSSCFVTLGTLGFICLFILASLCSGVPLWL